MKSSNHIAFDRSWCEIRFYVNWARLAGMAACFLRGHVDLNVMGDCKRCGADVLHPSTTSAERWRSVRSTIT